MFRTFSDCGGTGRRPIIVLVCRHEKWVDHRLSRYPALTKPTNAKIASIKKDRGNFRFLRQLSLQAFSSLWQLVAFVNGQIFLGRGESQKEKSEDVTNIYSKQARR